MKTINDFKGTKGEFRLNDSGTGLEILIKKDMLAAEIMIPFIFTSKDIEEAKANVKLFAASKDLLEACLLHINAVDNKPGDDLGQRAIAEAQIKMRKAIEKALK